jgi:hypothetical protein
VASRGLRNAHRPSRRTGPTGRAWMLAPAHAGGSSARASAVAYRRRALLERRRERISRFFGSVGARAA